MSDAVWVVLAGLDLAALAIALGCTIHRMMKKR